MIAARKGRGNSYGVTERPPRFFLSTGHPYGISSLMFSIRDSAN